MLLLPVLLLPVLLLPVRRVGLSERVYNPRLPSPKTAQNTAVARFANFLSEDDIDAIRQAAATVHDLVGEVSRSNGLEDDSWRTVFLNHRLPELLPEIHERLLGAAREADREWGVVDSDRFTLSLRCAEFHTVRTAGGLPKQKHYDAGSLITMDLMLSSADEFEGGTFQTLEANGELQAQPFERGDLLVFLSHKYHCVTPVTSGTRQVLVMELWEGLERRCPRRCNVPFGPCSCRMSRLYTRLDEEKRTDLAKVPFSRTTPTFVKHAWTKLRSSRRASAPRMKAERSPTPTPAPLSPSLLVADCVAIAAFSLLGSSIKAFALAAADVTSSFDLLADVVSFDLMATMQYVGIEQFGAASLAAGWLVGGVLSGACTDGWRWLDASARWSTLRKGYLIGGPLGVLLKYSVLKHAELPLLGQTVQAQSLQLELAELSASNVLGDALGMLVVLILWRRLLLNNPDLSL